jgi:hypothetical protein
MAAKEAELSVLRALGAFEVCELLVRRKAIGTRWVYKIERNVKGNIVRFEAQLVAQGFTQMPGIDFTHAFAPVAKITSIRVVAAIIAQLGSTMHAIDVDTAFLNSSLPDDQEVYVQQPPGYRNAHAGHLVWRILCALYGLKQAGFLWYQKLKSIMVKLHFKVSLADPCTFYCGTLANRDLIIVTAHVDNLGLFALEHTQVHSFKRKMQAKVPIKNLSRMRELLGMEILRNLKDGAVRFSHAHKICAVLKELRLEDLKPVSTPMLAGQQLVPRAASKDPQLLELIQAYQTSVGKLMHIAVMTRPDIAKAVQVVAQYMSNPSCSHLKAVNRIWAYLKSTPTHALTLGGSSLPREFIASAMLTMRTTSLIAA